MPTILPTDSNDHVIPAIRLKDGGAHAISVSAASARNAAAFDSETRIVGLYATGPVYIKCGDSSVTATTNDHYFPEGVYYDLAIGGDKVNQYTHIAALAADTNCILYISEKE
ncbi:MAG: hypothetical protein H6868_01120 [Rhodospirillales bacterium]|nr:hypothetical protein [Rhodospirillales bacterium]